MSLLFSVSLVLESWSVGRARRAIAALMELAPPVARVRDATGVEIEVPPDQVIVGTVFIVRPGEKIPLDGQVTRGESDVNQAPITGESAPVEKSTGSEVFAGTINGDGSLEIECTKRAEDFDPSKHYSHGRPSPIATGALGKMGRKVCTSLHARSDGNCCGNSAHTAVAVWSSMVR